MKDRVFVNPSNGGEIIVPDGYYEEIDLEEEEE